MKLNYLIALVLGGLLGCNSSPDETIRKKADSNSVFTKPMLGVDEFTKQQAKPLEEATISVKGAYNYNGLSYLEPTKEEKLVAVDIEFSNYRQEFDVDDVGIINGDEIEVYGYEPHIVPLNKDGELVREEFFWPEAPGPVRVLLIYAIPKESKAVKLGYWGSVITDKSVKLEEGGPVLKNPEKQDSQSTPSDGQ